MIFANVFNAVIPVPIILQGNKINAIALLASIAIVSVLIMLLSFTYYTVKCYCKHRARPDLNRFTFFDIWNDVSESVVFLFGGFSFLTVMVVVIIAGVYMLLIPNL